MIVNIQVGCFRRRRRRRRRRKKKPQRQNIHNCLPYWAAIKRVARQLNSN